MNKYWSMVLFIRILQSAHSIDIDNSTMSQDIQTSEQQPQELEDHQQNEVSTTTGDIAETTDNLAETTWILNTDGNGTDYVEVPKIQQNVPSGNYKLLYQVEKVESDDDNETTSTVSEYPAGKDELVNRTIDFSDVYTTVKQNDSRVIARSDLGGAAEILRASRETATAGHSAASTFRSNSILVYLAYMCFGTWIIFV